MLNLQAIPDTGITVHARGDLFGVYTCPDPVVLDRYLVDPLGVYDSDDYELVHTYELSWLSTHSLARLVENVQGMEQNTAEAYCTLVKALGYVVDLDAWTRMPVFLDATDEELARIWTEDLVGPVTDKAWSMLVQHLDPTCIVDQELAEDIVRAKGPSGREFCYLLHWAWTED